MRSSNRQERAEATTNACLNIHLLGRVYFQVVRLELGPGDVELGPITRGNPHKEGRFQTFEEVPRFWAAEALWSLATAVPHALAEAQEEVVGLSGFEPPISCSRSTRFSQAKLQPDSWGGRSRTCNIEVQSLAFYR